MEGSTVRKQRSPSYPGIGLEAAIERARTLEKDIGRSPAHVEVALKALGFGPKSGGGRVILAALKKFGLLDDEGARDRRQVRLTPLALRIILDPREDSAERAEAIRTAALAPTIHRELWTRYNGLLPSNDTLSTYLRVERAFTDSAVKEFVPQFKRTVAFAKLEATDTLSQDDGDKNGSDGANGDGGASGGGMTGAGTINPPVDPPRPPLPPRDPAAPLPVNILLARGGTATLQVSGRMTEAEWEQMMAVLNAQKPGLIAADE